MGNGIFLPILSPLGAPGVVGGAALAIAGAVLGIAVAVKVPISAELVDTGMKTPPDRHSERVVPGKYRGAKPGK